MELSQRFILEAVPRVARFVTLGLATGADPRACFERLSALTPDVDSVIGIGHPLLCRLGRELPGLRAFPALSGPAGSFPSTQGALWLCFGGEDAGVVLHRARKIIAALGPGFRIDEDVQAFRYAQGRDLSGYEDGTENPQGERAWRVALVQGQGAGLDDGSFVAVQRYMHDLPILDAMSEHERDFVMGRKRSSNEELVDAPSSAHVKRAAQESFEPTAFMLRRSMPWGDVREHGLYFVAYGATLAAFERVLQRMAGLEDGVPDALLRFTRPLSGGYYFCPALREGKLDLRALGNA
jgi:putative iron-dependent peroxidase